MTRDPSPPPEGQESGLLREPPIFVRAVPGNWGKHWSKTATETQTHITGTETEPSVPQRAHPERAQCARPHSVLGCTACDLGDVTSLPVPRFLHREMGKKQVCCATLGDGHVVSPAPGRASAWWHGRAGCTGSQPGAETQAHPGPQGISEGWNLYLVSRRDARGTQEEGKSSTARS